MRILWRKKPESNGNASNDRGVALMAQGDYDEAIKCFRAALKDPDHKPVGIAWTNLGLAHLHKQSDGESVKCFNKALGDPDFKYRGMAWSGLGSAYNSMGNQDESLRCFQQALEDPSHKMRGNDWNNLGLCRMHRGELDEAIRCFEQALNAADFAVPAAAWENLGLSYLKMKDSEKATKCFQTALDDLNYERRDAVLWQLTSMCVEEMGERLNEQPVAELPGEAIDKSVVDWLNHRYPDEAGWQDPEFDCFEDVPLELKMVAACSTLEYNVDNGGWGQVLWNCIGRWRELLQVAQDGYRLMGATDQAVAIDDLRELLDANEKECLQSKQSCNDDDWLDHFGKFTWQCHLKEHPPYLGLFCCDSGIYERRLQWLVDNEELVRSLMDR